VVAETTDAEVLNDLGLLLNVSEAELEAVLTRDVGVTMILKSLGYTQAQADQAAQMTIFTDVNDWAKGWASLAYQEGITAGIGGSLFDPSGILTKQQFVAFQLRALGYDPDMAWSDAEKLAEEAGLTSGGDLSDSRFTKSDAATIMYNALASIDQNTDKALISTLIADGVVSEVKAKTLGLISDVFKVTSIDEESYKLTALTFSKAVDGSTLTGDTVTVSVEDEELEFDDNFLNGIASGKYGLELEDEQTVSIIFGKANSFNDIVSIDVSGLQSEDGDKVQNYKKEFRLKDTDKPEIVDVFAVNQLFVKLEYNEPVQFKTGSRLFDDVYIDDVRASATATLSENKKVLTFELSNELDEGTHKLEIEGTLDYAGNYGDDHESTFKVANDGLEPYVLDVEVVNRDEVKIIFNEPIDDSVGEITINGKDYKLNDEDEVTVDEEEVYVALSSSLSASSVTSPVSGSYKNIQDLVGNRVKVSTSFTFKAEPDTVPPTLNVTLSDSNEIVLTFSEPVQSFSSLYFAVTKLDDNAEEELVGIASLIESSESVYKIILADPLIDGDTYTLDIRSIRDKSVYQNKLADTEVELEMNDLNRPSIDSVKLLGNDVVRVLFSEPMKERYISNPDYYEFYDKSSTSTINLEDVSNYKLTVDDDHEYVDIYIPNVTSSDKIIVGKVEDESGLVLSGYGTQKSITLTASFSVTDLSAELISEKVIKVTADGHEFDAVSADDFDVRNQDGISQYHYVYKASVDNEDPEIIYLTLNAALDSDGKYDGEKQYLYIDEDSNVDTVDTYGKVLEIAYSSPLLIEDGMAPTISLDTDIAETLIIEFSEVVGADSNTKVLNDIFLKNSDGDEEVLSFSSNVGYEGGNESNNFFDKLVISGLDPVETYTLRVVSRYIQDSADNEVIGFEMLGIVVEE